MVFLKVASRWQEVTSVLVDDFIGTGTEQMLLLFKNESNTDSLSTFIITDLGEVSYESNINCKEDFPPTEELQENGFLTIQALEARLQAGCTSVRELQQHLRLKEKVLFESCCALIDLVQEREHILPTAEEEGLVSLWDDTENLHPLDKKMTLTAEVPEYLIEKLWQRVVDDSLVIGVKITESPNLSLNDVSLSLVMERDFTSVSPVIECQSKIVKLNKTFSALSISSCQMEPQPKRIKLDFHSENDLKKEYPRRPSKIPSDGAKTFVAVTRLSPLLAFRDICCMILLHAKRRKYQDGNLQESRQLTLLCGKISLCLEDISSGKYSINLLRNNSHCTGIMEDIFAILAISLKFSFQIVSSDCTLTPVNMWLLSQMECMPIKECPENMFCHKLGSLHGTIFNWNLQTPFEGTLTLFCRNQTVLFQCLHSLLGVLPPTCKVKPLRLESKDILTDQFALALEKEMVTLRSSFSSAVSEVENNLTLSCEAGKKMSRVTVSSLSDKKEAVRQFREELQNEQKQSALGMNQTVSGALYRQITSEITEAQLCSDTIAWRLNIS